MPPVSLDRRNIFNTIADTWNTLEYYFKQFSLWAPSILSQFREEKRNKRKKKEKARIEKLRQEGYIAMKPTENEDGEWEVKEYEVGLQAELKRSAWKIFDSILDMFTD